MPSSSRRWKFRIEHLLGAAAENTRFLQEMTFDEFAEDDKTLKAVVWNLTIIGEIVRHVPPEVQQRYHQIPWAAIRGMRNRIVHEYDTIDAELVWNVVRDEFPPLIPIFVRLLEETEE
jgi:uncharacterized protein with HEPN domain